MGKTTLSYRKSCSSFYGLFNQKWRNLKARESDESEGYILSNNNLLLLVENIDSLEDIVESQGFAKRVDPTCLKELTILIKSFIALKNAEGAKIETSGIHESMIEAEKPQLKVMNFNVYPESMRLNQINKAKINKMLLSIDERVKFKIQAPVEGDTWLGMITSGVPAVRSKQEPLQVDKRKFQLSHHVFYYKTWRTESDGQEEKRINESFPAEHAMIEENEEETILELEEGTASNKPNANRQARSRSKQKRAPKPADLVKNLDGLNISDHLKAKFLQCVKPQTPHNSNNK